MQSFDEIIGHEKIKEHLQSAISMDKVSHAYIFNGAAGSGKKSMAKIFAKTLQCEEGKSVPCNKCRSCIQSDSNNQPDIKFIKTEEKKSIGVGQIREELIDDIQIKPYSSRYKIYVIVEAEKMTLEAQNAILKTIEEPPEYGIIILLTDNADVLITTILSRCIKLDFRPIENEKIEKYVMRTLQMPDYEARFAASFAQGRIGRAIEIVYSNDFKHMRDDALHLIKYSNEMTITEMIDAAKHINNYKAEINDFIDLLAMWYRDVLVFKSTNKWDSLVFKDMIGLIKRQAETISYEGIQNILDAFDTAKVRIKSNVNFDLTMELMFFTIRDYCN